MSMSIRPLEAAFAAMEIDQVGNDGQRTPERPTNPSAQRAPRKDTSARPAYMPGNAARNLNDIFNRGRPS